VVAVQEVEDAAGFLGFTAQALEQIEHLAIVVAAIDLISSLDDAHLSAGPVIARVDRAGQSQDGASRRQVSVQVADRDQPFTQRIVERNAACWRRFVGRLARDRGFLAAATAGFGFAIAAASGHHERAGE
jgi:hypothetical protein